MKTKTTKKPALTEDMLAETMAEAVAEQRTKYPLVGLCLLIFAEPVRGERALLQYQGVVEFVDGDYVAVSIYSPLIGTPLYIQGFPKSFIYSDRCKLFTNGDDWRHHGSEEIKRIERSQRRTERGAK